MRAIPAALKQHLQQNVTTTCRLLRITMRDGRVFGMTSLDADVVYEGVTYSAANGFDSSVIATDSDLSVDNAEGYALLSADISGITAEMVAAGELDDAQWEMRLINWASPEMGHMIIDAGDLGEVNVEDGVVYAPELLSYAMRLRQPIGHFWSRLCRATFGSPAQSQTGCGVNADALWISATVSNVSADESNRVFAATGLTLDPIPRVARVQFTSGPNAGSRAYQVEGYSAASGTIALIEPAPFPIEAGQTFRIRPDCDKSPAACLAYGNWLNYKGESLIPVGEGTAVLTPSASMSGGFMGSEIIE